MAPCHCCCPQLTTVNNSPFATTVKFSPDGDVLWYFDSGRSSNAGQLAVDRYFALLGSYTGSTLLAGRMTVLGLDGEILSDSQLTSSNTPFAGAGNMGFGGAALESGGCAFAGPQSASSNTPRVSFWDATGAHTGVWSPAGGEYMSDLAPVGDGVCVRLDDFLAGTLLNFRFVDDTGTLTGTEALTGAGGDLMVSAAGNIASFGSSVLLCGTFDVNGNGTYQNTIDHRYRLYAVSGPPETSGVTHTTGDVTWGTRRGTNSYILCVSIAGITKVTDALSISRNTISGVTEGVDDVRDVKEDSAGNVMLLTNAKLYQFPQSGGAANWTVSLSEERRVACDANGNSYVWSSALRKYNSSGTLQWTAGAPSISFSRHSPAGRYGLGRDTSMHIDADDCIYVTGNRVAASDLG